MLNKVLWRMIQRRSWRSGRPSRSKYPRARGSNGSRYHFWETISWKSIPVGWAEGEQQSFSLHYPFNFVCFVCLFDTRSKSRCLFRNNDEYTGPTTCSLPLSPVHSVCRQCLKPMLRRPSWGLPAMICWHVRVLGPRWPALPAPESAALKREL